MTNNLMSSNLKKQILVVEDDQYIRESLQELLESEGYSVACASNGQEALDHLSTKKSPGLIFLDLMMPIKDGFQFRQEMRVNPLWVDIPIVIMSADGQIKEKFLRMGVKSYLKKPVDIDVIIDLANRFAG
jgi:CheY-like chemotaxis protein